MKFCTLSLICVFMAAITLHAEELPFTIQPGDVDAIVIKKHKVNANGQTELLLTLNPAKREEFRKLYLPNKNADKNIDVTIDWGTDSKRFSQPCSDFKMSNGEVGTIFENIEKAATAARQLMQE